MAKFDTHFIPENVIPGGYINVFNGNTLIGKVKAGALRMPELGEKLYSFGVLADVHVTVSNAAQEKFINAIKYLNDEEGTAFVCIAGDLTGQGTADQFRQYISAVEEAKSQCERDADVHDTTGNHDVEQGVADKSYLQAYADGQEPYASRELYYSFEHGGDVFIMFGMTGWPGKNGNSILFLDESLQWLYETLEANRNRRVFLFQHCPYFAVADGLVTAGDGVVIGWPPPTGGYIGDTGSDFMRLMRHYRNVIWFHGHTHQGFGNQTVCSGINYNRNLGFHSVHVPALVGDRVMSSEGYVKDDSTQGMGYVVDVHEKHIVLRGRDFAAEKFVPIATYCLDTTMKEIPAGTFVGNTGIITT